MFREELFYLSSPFFHFSGAGFLTVVVNILFILYKKNILMRKVILAVAVTLDGYIEGPQGEFDWCFTDRDYGMNDFLKNIDAVFYGRKSYELMMKWEDGNPFGKIKSYVFSNTWSTPQEGIELISGNLEDKVKALKNTAGRNIWLFGGASLTTAFVNSGLLDEVWVSVHPLLLGGGKPLFSGIDGRVQLKLLESKAYESGLVSLRYDVVHEAGRQPTTNNQ